MTKGNLMRSLVVLGCAAFAGLSVATSAFAQQPPLLPPGSVGGTAESGQRGTVRIDVLPPRRPASLATARPAPASSPPQVAAQPMDMKPAPAIVPVAAPSTPAAPAGPLTDRQLVDRANLYFNGLGTLVADFVQVGGDGRRTGGRLYLQRPGKLRFEYASPSTLEVIADGSSVAVRDRKLATQDLYNIGQTPLKFLLRDRVTLGLDIRVTDVERDPSGVRIALEDRSTLGGTSKITLFFDPAVETLSQWRIIDPQGFQTTVVLSNIDRTRRVDPQLFVINYERVLEVR
jgi:outer membrane lipoprotein-sorting protein